MARIVVPKKTTKLQVISQNAALLFRQKGYSAASMRELAELINIEAPSLYNHIDNKAHLLQLICEDIAGKFTRHLEEVEANELPASKKLEQLIRFHIKMMVTHFDALFVANHEWKHLPELAQTAFLQQRKNYENGMVQIIKQGITEGELKNHHPQIAALTILSALRGLEFWHKYHKLVKEKILENNIVQQLLTGIKK